MYPRMKGGDALKPVTRRDLIYGAGAGLLLAQPSPTQSIDLPHSYADAVASTSSNLMTYIQSGLVPAFSLADHFYAASNVFAYAAANGLNSELAGPVVQSLQSDPSILNRIPDLMIAGAQHTGVALDPRLLNLDRSLLPTPDLLVQMIGGDLSYIQNTFSDQLVNVFTTLPNTAVYRDRIMFRHRSLQRVLQRGLPSPQVLIHPVVDWGFLGALAGAAGGLLGVGSALIGLAGTTMLGTGAFATASLFAVWLLGVAFTAAAAFLIVYGTLLVLDNLHSGLFPPVSGRKLTDN